MSNQPQEIEIFSPDGQVTHFEPPSPELIERQKEDEQHLLERISSDMHDTIFDTVSEEN